jgi:hypothetical protein
MWVPGAKTLVPDPNSEKNKAVWADLGAPSQPQPPAQ